MFLQKIQYNPHHSYWEVRRFLWYYSLNTQGNILTINSMEMITLMRHLMQNMDDLVIMYRSLIRPCLEYANVLLVGCTKKHAALLESIQKRALWKIIIPFINFF